MIVKFDEKLARKNELTKLVGDNSKIKALFGDVPLSNRKHITLDVNLDAV